MWNFRVYWQLFHSKFTVSVYFGKKKHTNKQVFKNLWNFRVYSQLFQSKFTVFVYFEKKKKTLQVFARMWNFKVHSELFHRTITVFVYFGEKKTQRKKSSKNCEILGHIHSWFTENSQFLFTLEKPGKKQSIFTVVSQKNHSFCLLWKKQQKRKQFSKKTGKFQFLKIFLHKQNS